MTIWSSPDAWSTLRKPAGRNTRPLLSAFASMLPKNLIYSYIITRTLIIIIICVQNYTIFPTFHHFSPLFFRILYFFYFQRRNSSKKRQLYKIDFWEHKPFFMKLQCSYSAKHSLWKNEQYCNSNYSPRLEISFKKNHFSFLFFALKLCPSS